MSGPIIPGMHGLELVNVALACPLLASPAAFINIGKAWGSDGGIEFAEAEADAEFVMGAGGKGTFVMSGNDLITATITVTPTSVAYRLLGQLYRDWFRALKTGGQFLPIAFNLVDPTNGDISTDPGAGMLSPGMLTKQKSLTDNQWVFGLPNGKKLLQHGTLNLIGP